jgi:hypothetical protein
MERKPMKNKIPCKIGKCESCIHLEMDFDSGGERYDCENLIVHLECDDHHTPWLHALEISKFGCIYYEEKTEERTVIDEKEKKMKIDDIDSVRLPPPTTPGMEITIKNTSDKSIQVIPPEPLYFKIEDHKIKYYWEEVK